MSNDRKVRALISSLDTAFLLRKYTEIPLLLDQLTLTANPERYMETIIQYKDEWSRIQQSENEHTALVTGYDGYMLDERSKIDNQGQATDDLLQQAYSVRGELADQRQRLQGTNARFSNMNERMPMIGGLIRRIGIRKTKDTIILASVIAGCICLILWIKYG